MSLPRAFQDRLDRRVGSMLIAAAVEFQSDMKRSLSKSYPPASRPGQFPAWRTGNLREGIVYQPTDPLTVGREGRVRVGYSVNAFYGAILELKRHRLGLLATLRRMAGRVGKWLAAARRVQGES